MSRIVFDTVWGRFDSADFEFYAPGPDGRPAAPLVVDDDFIHGLCAPTADKVIAAWDEVNAALRQAAEDDDEDDSELDDEDDELWDDDEDDELWDDDDEDDDEGDEEEDEEEDEEGRYDEDDEDD